MPTKRSMPPHKNAFRGSVTYNTPVPRFKKELVGTAGGYQMVKCLVNCDTPKNKLSYPYLARYNKGEMEFYPDPALLSPIPEGGTKRRRNRRNCRNISNKRRRSRSRSRSRSKSKSSRRH